MNVTNSAVKELEKATTFSLRAELCVWGRETRRLRDWELSLLAIRNPERFIHIHPDESESFSAAAKKLRADCELCLGKHLAEACVGDGDEFENLCAAMARAYSEHRKRDPWRPLTKRQMEAFKEWINEPLRTRSEQQRQTQKNERKSAISRVRIWLKKKMENPTWVERWKNKTTRFRYYAFKGARRYAVRRESARLQRMSVLSDQSLAHARHNALQALRLANVATHPIHAAVLMFSRKFTPDEKWSMREHSIREMAATDGFAAGLPIRLERLGIKISCSVFEMFEGNTTQEALTASALQGRLQELLGRAVSAGDVREAASALGVKLSTSPPGAKPGRKPAPRRSARN